MAFWDYTDDEGRLMDSARQFFNEQNAKSSGGSAGVGCGCLIPLIVLLFSYAFLFLVTLFLLLIIDSDIHRMSTEMITTISYVAPAVIIGLIFIVKAIKRKREN